MKPGNQLSVAGPALSTVVQALGSVGGPFGMGYDMRNTGKLAAPLLDNASSWSPAAGH
jgi:hypothetical protein